MYLAQVIFGSVTDDREEFVVQQDAVETYLAYLCKDGQLYGDYLSAPCDGKWIAYAYVPRPGAWLERHHSQWGAAALKEIVAKVFGQVPQWRILADDAPKRFPAWKRCSSLYLFTHAFDRASPICCGDSGVFVPVYLLPLSDLQREDLGFWASAYRHLDNLWLASGSLEMPAYKELADPASQLATEGRRLCKEIEKATEIPTYYYLLRYWGRLSDESDRRCLLCGGKWQVTNSDEDRPFHQFDFRCRRCRLVSHLASADDDQRRARIGEYRGKDG